MRIGVIGSRNIENKEIVFNTMSEVVRTIEDDCIPYVLLGGASKGCERLVADWAYSVDVDYVLFKPYNFVDTSVAHDPKYFFFRNKQIIDNSDSVVVFLDDKENGVKRTIEYIEHKTKKPYVVFNGLGEVIERRLYATVPNTTSLEPIKRKDTSNYDSNDLE